MAFSTRRGRPATARPTHDTGTPELVYKRAHGLTAEPLDTCLQRGFITESQHKSGLHLRWLYTLRYGAPTPSACDLERAQHGLPPARIEDCSWRRAREEEFAEARSLLEAQRLYRPVMALCVYNEPPQFLTPHAIAHAAESRDRTRLSVFEAELSTIRAALDLLHAQWQRTRSTARSRALSAVQHSK